MSIELNENQSKAAYYDGDKYLVIEAGPGAGKTRVLIERIKFLINVKKVDPSSLLVITFTRKAADELKERLYSDISESQVNMMQISTIHAFCRVILSSIGEYNTRILGDSVNERLKMFLNKYKKELGFTNEYSILQKEIWNLIDKYGEYATFNVNTEKLIEYIENNTEISPDYIDFVNEYMKNNDGKYPFNEVFQNDSYKKSRTNALYLQIAKSYPRYLELLDEKGFSDFNQMQIKALDYLKKHPETIYKNILIDEFQDTDPVQMKIFEVLMKHAESFTVVGDIDQSIYGFRGANRNYFEYLYNNYDNKVYKINLNVNYRSANQIINLSEDFIKSQRAAGAKQDKAIGDRNLDRDTYFLVNESNENEARAIFEMIRHLYDSGKVENYNEIAIFSRSIRYSNTAKDLIQLFIDNDIPYHVRGVPDLFDRPEIRSALILIHHLIDDDNPHRYKFSNWELDWLNLKAYTGKNFNQVLFNLSDETKAIINNLQDDFEKKVMIEEKKAYLKIMGKPSQKKSFKGIFERREDILIETFTHLERPILSDENLIKYGVKDKNDLEFFKRLNKLKDYVHSEEYLDSDDTLLDIYLRLLTDICNFLTEDAINKNLYREEMENLAIISNTFHNFELIVDNKDLRGVYNFLKFNIGGYSTNKDGSEGVQLMTVHKSKGLEFPVVILLSLNDKKFPKEFKDKQERFYTPNSCLNYKNYDSLQEEIKEYDEEEERIVYVAMTRAQDILILSNLINQTPALDELRYDLRDNVSEIKRKEIIKDIPKGHIKVHNLINRNLDYCKFLDGDYSRIPKTICEKPKAKKEQNLNLSFNALEDYIECPFKYKIMHDIHFAESTLEYNKLRGLFIHNILETINNRIQSNGNQYIGDKEVLSVLDKFKSSFRFENLKLSKEQFSQIKNDILYYYNYYGKDLDILLTEERFSIKKEFYSLSGIIDLVYKTKEGKIGIMDYKNTSNISEKYLRNYIKQIYTYIIGLDNCLKIEELKIYAVKARTMINVELNQKSIDILLEELDSVSENIRHEVFECNMGEDCKDCSFSAICIKSMGKDSNVFDFAQDKISGFRGKFYDNLPNYEIIDLNDKYFKDIDFKKNSDEIKPAASDKTEEKLIKTTDSGKVVESDSYENKPIENDPKPIKSSDLKSSPSQFNKNISANECDNDYAFIRSIKVSQFKYKYAESDMELLEYDESLSKEENIYRKYVLKKKGLKLIKNKSFEEAKDYYRKLLSNSYYIDDFYPYKQLIKLYHKTKDYHGEADLIREFFKTSIHTNKYQFLFFKYRNMKLRKKLRIKDDELNELVKNYLNNMDQSSKFPNADNLKKVKYHLKILSDEEEFYSHKKHYYINIANGLYDEKLNQEAFDLYCIGIYKFKDSSFRNYQRLASIYRRTKNYKHELLVILEYFNKKSKIQRTKNSDKWFNERLDSTIELIGDDAIVEEIKSIEYEKAYHLKVNYDLNNLNHNLNGDFSLINLKNELNHY